VSVKDGEEERGGGSDLDVLDVPLVSGLRRVVYDTRLVTGRTMVSSVDSGGDPNGGGVGLSDGGAYGRRRRRPLDEQKRCDMRPCPGGKR